MRFIQEMRLLLSSADRLQIERLARILPFAGIPTHVRGARVWQTTSEGAKGGELWVNSERDYEAAVMLFGGAVSAVVFRLICQPLHVRLGKISALKKEDLNGGLPIEE